MIEFDELPDTRAWFSREHLESIGIRFAKRSPDKYNRIAYIPDRSGRIGDERGIIDGCYHTQRITIDE